MKKQEDKKSKSRLRNANPAPWVIQPQAMSAPLDPLESALAVAALIAAPYPEEVEAIENVIRFVRGRRCGEPLDIPRSDLLLALSIIISSLEEAPPPEIGELFDLLDITHGIRRRPVPDRVFATAPPYASSVVAPRRLRPFADPYGPVSPSSVNSSRFTV